MAVHAGNIGDCLESMICFPLRLVPAHRITSAFQDSSLDVKALKMIEKYGWNDMWWLSQIPFPRTPILISILGPHLNWDPAFTSMVASKWNDDLMASSNHGFCWGRATTTMSNDVESHPKDHCGLGLSLKHLPVRTSGPTSTSSWVDGELKFAASYGIDADSKTRTTLSVVMLHDYCI